MAPGHPDLNPGDQTGIQYFHLNNTSTETTEPVIEIGPNTTLPNGWPADGLTVPPEGIRVRILYSSETYPDTVTSVNNAVGTPDVSFRFTISSAVSYQAFEAYLLDGTGDTGAYSRDMYLSLVKVSEYRS